MTLYNGLPPDPNAIRRSKPQYEGSQLIRREDRKLLGPNLPNDRVWCERTQLWWKTWRRSEIALILEPSDWDSLLDTAVLHNAYWSGDLPPNTMTAYAAEIRRRVSDYGATYSDRLKLRLKFAPPPEGNDEASSPANHAGVDYEAMLS